MLEKVYNQPGGNILQAISDIVELQKGDFTFSDTPNGKISFVVTMYGYKWEFQFVVTDIDKDSSKVVLEISGEKINKDEMLHRQIALLDSMLNTGKQTQA